MKRVAVLALLALSGIGCGGAVKPVAATPVPNSPEVSAAPANPSPSAPGSAGFGPGDCTAAPTGLRTGPAGDNFKVVIQVPDGWQAVETGPTETLLFQLVASGDSRQPPPTLRAFSHIGKFAGQTPSQVATNSFKGDPKTEMVGQAIDCTVGGGPASYVRYTRTGGIAGLWVFFLHRDFLYSVQLEENGDLDPKAVQAAKAVLGSWSWTDPAPSAGDRQVPLLLNLGCRLPARVDPLGPAGFLDLSTGRFTVDGSASTVGSYSWGARRWVPVPYNQVAPDGLHYARVEDAGSGNTRVHVVDLASGGDRVLMKDGPWYVADYASEGVYVEKRNTAANYGLWLLDPATGDVRQVLPESVVGLTLGGGAAWVEDVVSEGPVARAVYRIDLVTGVRTLWFSRTLPFAVYYASDASNKAIVSWESVAINDHATELWLLSRPQEGVLLYSGSHEGEPFPSAVVDANGVWFAGNSSKASLWLLTPANELRKVAATPVQPLGGCH